jgi:serine/threonine protein kinase
MASCQSCGTGFETGRFCPACGRAVRSSRETQDPLLGSVIDGLRFDSVLGRGMTGSVYRATQLALDRPIAVKVPNVALASDPVAVRRFRREALALARIVHPGVVGVHAVGEMPDGRPYLAIEFLDGHTLETAIGDARIPPARAVDLALQIAEALAETHAHDIVHRDLKPDNIMLVKPQIGGERAILIDFGLALPVATADSTRLTAGGGLVGTPHYMAPEQVQGDDIDGRADIYALGATMYRLLTGRVPFDGTGVEVVVAHLARTVVPVRTLVPEVSAELEAIVMRCLAKRVSDRWPTAIELARALAEVDSGPRTPRSRRISNLPPVGTRPDSPARAVVNPTAVTRRPRPISVVDDVPPPRPRRTGQLIGGIFALAALGAVAAFAIAYRDGRTANARHDVGSGGSAVETPLVAEPRPAPTRALVVDDGGLSMRVVVPELIPVGAPVRFALEIWDADGAPVAASEIVVTVEAETGESRGFSAARAGLGRSVFAFTTRFATAGRYKLRVFPPVGDATFVVDIDVSPA